MSVRYAQEQSLGVDDYIAVLSRNTLGKGRPLANRARIAAMLAGANFIVTARDEDGALLGLARCMTDGAWVCYCMDLAVRDDQQGKGIGRRLVETCKELLGPRIGFILVSEPAAEDFYRRIGMKQYSAFFISRTDPS